MTDGLLVLVHINVDISTMRMYTKEVEITTSLL